MKRAAILMAVVTAVCLCFVVGCSSSNGKTEMKNVTFKYFSMDVPAKMVEDLSEAELRNNTVQIKTDDSTTPEAFIMVSSISSPYSFRDSYGWMMSSVGDDMESIEVDGTEAGINFSKVPNYHKTEIVCYADDYMTQIRVFFEYKDTAQEKWEKYSEEFYKTIKFN